MKKYSIFLALILLLLSIVFQGFGINLPKSDSVISNREIIKRKKIIVNVLNENAYLYRLSADSISYKLANNALKLSKEINYLIGEASANNNIGFFYYKHQKFLKAIEHLNATLLLYQQQPGDTVLMYANQLCGSIFYSLKRYDRAEVYLRKGISLAKKKNNVERIINLSIGIGLIMNEKGEMNDALNYFYYAYSLSKTKADINFEVWVLLNIGNLYLSHNQVDLALSFYKQAINKSDQALQVVNGKLYTLVGHIYELKSDYTNALEYNRIALSTRRKNDYYNLVASSLINIGHIYLKMGILDSSLYYLQTGLKTAKNSNANDFKENGYLNLYELYNLKKDWHHAFLALKDYIVSKEIFSSEINQNKIFILETNRIISEKEKETLLLKSENNIQSLQMRNRGLLILLFVSLFFLTLIVVVFIINLFLKNKKEKQIVEEINTHLQDEIKEKEIENEELSKSEKHFRFLADNAADPIVLMDNNFKCLYVSPFSELVLGYTPAELTEMNDFREIIHPDSQRAFQREFDTMLEFGDSSRFIYQAVKKDGSSFWAESTINPILNESTKELKAMLAISRDISHKIDQEEAMMQATSQREMMIKEVHHRVKNNLAILASIVSMQQREFSDTKTINVFSDLQFRVKAMALVHEQLYKSRDIEELEIRGYISNLIQTVSSTFGNSRIKVHGEIYDEVLEVETVLSLGLILNELLTNAYKYAFPDNREGNIWVIYKKTRRQKRSPYPMRQLTVKDDGIGLPDNFTLKDRTSMGSQIIDLLSEQLEADLVIDGTNGASFSLTLPTRR
ncbi:MAG: PAS domain S-box protein [Bacteroidetes bacterium]|nr:PAS domain S-box protein [Bacteroidota bacterium]